MVLPIGNWLVFSVFWDEFNDFADDFGVGKPSVLQPGDAVRQGSRYVIFLKYNAAAPPGRAVRNALRKYGLAGDLNTSGFSITPPKGMQMYVVNPERDDLTAADYVKLLKKWGPAVVVGNVPGVVEPTPIMWDTSMRISAQVDEGVPIREILILVAVVGVVGLLAYNAGR